MCTVPSWAWKCHVLSVLSLFLILMPLSGMASRHIKLPFNILIRVLYQDIYKKRNRIALYKNQVTHSSHILLVIMWKRKPYCSLFLCPIYNLFLKESHCYSVSINCNGAASIDTLCQVLQMFLYYPTMHTIFKVIFPSTHRTSVGSYFFLFPSVGQLHSDQISFGPLLPSKNPPQSQHGWYPH